jgi:hypothetical protein
VIAATAGKERREQCECEVAGALSGQMHLRAPVYTAIYPGAVELDPRQSNLPRKRLFIP